MAIGKIQALSIKRMRIPKNIVLSNYGSSNILVSTSETIVINLATANHDASTVGKGVR